MAIFKVEAEGDTIYIEAGDKEEAQAKLTAVFGSIPESLLTWTEGAELPEGEEAI